MSKEMNTLRIEAGARLWRYALATPPETAKAAILAGLPAGRRKMAKVAAAALVRRIVDMLADLRRAKVRRRRYFGHRRRCGPAWQPRTVYRRPAGSLVERLRARIERDFPAHLMRTDAPGGHSLCVSVTDDPAAVSWRVKIDHNRNTYKGRWATEDHHAITLPRAWLSRVYKRGLACVDDLPTLDAAPLLSPVEGVEMFAITFATQGRGYDVKTQRGYLARRQGYAYHGETVKAALAGLRRKMQLPQERDSAAVARLAAKHGHKPITPEHAYAAGACRYGVESWRRRVGLMDRDVATIAEVAAAWKRDPAPEAIAAMRRAARQ